MSGTTAVIAVAAVLALRYPEASVSCYSVTVHLEQTGEIWEHGRMMRTETRETRVVAVVAPESLQAPRMQLLPRGNLIQLYQKA
jgi:hypothetical protein